jgi:acyl-coenzyme A synthetase/AMP-(fatty) acid ligase
VAVITPATADADAAALAERLHTFCRQQAASFKVPRLWFHIEAMPMTASGKIQKFVLRQRIVDGEMKPDWTVL